MNVHNTLNNTILFTFLKIDVIPTYPTTLFPRCYGYSFTNGRFPDFPLKNAFPKVLDVFYFLKAMAILMIVFTFVIQKTTRISQWLSLFFHKNRRLQ